LWPSLRVVDVVSLLGVVVGAPVVGGAVVVSTLDDVVARSVEDDVVGRRMVIVGVVPLGLFRRVVVVVLVVVPVVVDAIRVVVVRVVVVTRLVVGTTVVGTSVVPVGHSSGRRGTQTRRIRSVSTSGVVPNVALAVIRTLTFPGRVAFRVVGIDNV